MNLEDALEILTQSTEPEMDAEDIENDAILEKETEEGVDNKDV